MKRKGGQTVLEYAYENIKQRVQDCVFDPGEQLVTQKLSDELGISRTPVVAAVNRLVAEGYLESIPQRGFFVKQVSVKTIRDIFEVRMMIELYILPSVMRNIPFYPTILDQMRGFATQMHNLDDYDYEKGAHLDTQFHRCYVSLSGNAEILNIWETSRCIGTTYHMYKTSRLPLTSMQKTYVAHMDIVDLLAQGDEKKLKVLLDKHIQAPSEALDWLVNSGLYENLTPKKI